MSHDEFQSPEMLPPGTGTSSIEAMIHRLQSARNKRHSRISPVKASPISLTVSPSTPIVNSSSSETWLSPFRMYSSSPEKQNLLSVSYVLNGNMSDGLSSTSASVYMKLLLMFQRYLAISPHKSDIFEKLDRGHFNSNALTLFIFLGQSIANVENDDENAGDIVTNDLWLRKHLRLLVRIVTMNDLFNQWCLFSGVQRKGYRSTPFPRSSQHLIQSDFHYRFMLRKTIHRMQETVFCRKQGKKSVSRLLVRMNTLMRDNSFVCKNDRRRFNLVNFFETVSKNCSPASLSFKEELLIKFSFFQAFRRFYHRLHYLPLSKRTEYRRKQYRKTSYFHRLVDWIRLQNTQSQLRIEKSNIFRKDVVNARRLKTLFDSWKSFRLFSQELRNHCQALRSSIIVRRVVAFLASSTVARCFITLKRNYENKVRRLTFQDCQRYRKLAILHQLRRTLRKWSIYSKRRIFYTLYPLIEVVSPSKDLLTPWKWNSSTSSLALGYENAEISSCLMSSQVRFRTSCSYCRYLARILDNKSSMFSNDFHSSSERIVSTKQFLQLIESLKLSIVNPSISFPLQSLWKLYRLMPHWFPRNQWNPENHDFYRMFDKWRNSRKYYDRTVFRIFSFHRSAMLFSNYFPSLLEESIASIVSKSTVVSPMKMMSISTPSTSSFSKWIDRFSIIVSRTGNHTLQVSSNYSAPENWCFVGLSISDAGDYSQIPMMPSFSCMPFEPIMNTKSYNSSQCLLEDDKLFLSRWVAIFAQSSSISTLETKISIVSPWKSKESLKIHYPGYYLILFRRWRRRCINHRRQMEQYQSISSAKSASKLTGSNARRVYNSSIKQQHSLSWSVDRVKVTRCFLFLRKWMKVIKFERHNAIKKCLSRWIDSYRHVFLPQLSITSTSMIFVRRRSWTLMAHQFADYGNKRKSMIKNFLGQIANWPVFQSMSFMFWLFGMWLDLYQQEIGLWRGPRSSCRSDTPSYTQEDFIGWKWLEILRSERQGKARKWWYSEHELSSSLSEQYYSSNSLKLMNALFLMMGKIINRSNPTSKMKRSWKSFRSFFQDFPQFVANQKNSNSELLNPNDDNDALYLHSRLIEDEKYAHKDKISWKITEKRFHFFQGAGVIAFLWERMRRGFHSWKIKWKLHQKQRKIFNHQNKANLALGWKNWTSFMHQCRCYKAKSQLKRSCRLRFLQQILREWKCKYFRKIHDRQFHLCKHWSLWKQRYLVHRGMLLIINSWKRQMENCFGLWSLHYRQCRFSEQVLSLKSFKSIMRRHLLAWRQIQMLVVFRKKFNARKTLRKWKYWYAGMIDRVSRYHQYERYMTQHKLVAFLRKWYEQRSHCVNHQAKIENIDAWNEEMKARQLLKQWKQKILSRKIRHSSFMKSFRHHNKESSWSLEMENIDIIKKFRKRWGLKRWCSKRFHNFQLCKRRELQFLTSLKFAREFVVAKCWWKSWLQRFRKRQQQTKRVELYRYHQAMKQWKSFQLLKNRRRDVLLLCQAYHQHRNQIWIWLQWVHFLQDKRYSRRRLQESEHYELRRLVCLAFIRLRSRTESARLRYSDRQRMKQSRIRVDR